IASDYGDLREHIRTAYLAVTGGMFNKRALLSDVRKHLPNVDRATLDNTLELMQRDGDATLMQLDNRPDITPADEEAAIRIGAEAAYILWISKCPPNSKFLARQISMGFDNFKASGVIRHITLIQYIRRLSMTLSTISRN